MELINLNLNDDDIFDQSEAEKLDRESTYWQALIYEQAPAKISVQIKNHVGEYNSDIIGHQASGHLFKYYASKVGW